MSKQKSVRRFTGYHATMIIVAFFAVVVGVNMVMARFALSTFGGTVVDNSYVASQKYNEWLKRTTGPWSILQMPTAMPWGARVWSQWPSIPLAGPSRLTSLLQSGNRGNIEASRRYRTVAGN